MRFGISTRFYGWHQRHCDTHKLDLIEKPSILTRFFSDVLDVVAFGVGASLSALFLFGVLTPFVALIGGSKPLTLCHALRTT